MKFRLDAQHYLHDRLLEAGTEIGEDVGIPMVLPNGERMKPSVYMTPLDEEAKALFSETFPGTKLPERDPTKAIPLRGTGDIAKQPGTVPAQTTPVVPPKPHQDPNVATKPTGAAPDPKKAESPANPAAGTAEKK